MQHPVHHEGTLVHLRRPVSLSGDRQVGGRPFPSDLAQWVGSVRSGSRCRPPGRPLRRRPRRPAGTPDDAPTTGRAGTHLTRPAVLLQASMTVRPDTPPRGVPPYGGPPWPLPPPCPTVRPASSPSCADGPVLAVAVHRGPLATLPQLTDHDRRPVRCWSAYSATAAFTAIHRPTPAVDPYPRAGPAAHRRPCRRSRSRDRGPVPPERHTARHGPPGGQPQAATRVPYGLPTRQDEINPFRHLTQRDAG
jgi:hypothetical protein